jgi:hypothetical protein
MNLIDQQPPDQSKMLYSKFMKDSTCRVCNIAVIGIGSFEDQGDGMGFAVGGHGGVGGGSSGQPG